LRSTDEGFWTFRSLVIWRFSDFSLFKATHSVGCSPQRPTVRFITMSQVENTFVINRSFRLQRPEEEYRQRWASDGKGR
jgi:hypothetical protein